MAIARAKSTAGSIQIYNKEIGEFINNLLQCTKQKGTQMEL